MHWEHFKHGADIGVRGIGATQSEAFEQTALALVAVIADLASVRTDTPIRIRCAAPDDELLLVDWLNAVIYEMATRAMLPGIVKASFAMPDAHWGYGFPIGGVEAFDPDHGGVVSAGGVGFDISCGVRTLVTGLTRDDIERVKRPLADTLFTHIPAGVGSTGAIELSPKQMDAML